MATSDFMKRIAFLDGQILHDYHLNTMQENIAQSIKIKTTQERYDVLLLVSAYSYYFAEHFVNEDKMDPTSTAVVDKLNFCLNGGAWVTPLLELPQVTSEIYMLSNYIDYPSQGSEVRFYYRTATTQPWKQIPLDTAEGLITPTKFVQVKIDCLYTTYTRPQVFDFALMWK